jgi:hypothetical protein
MTETCIILIYYDAGLTSFKMQVTHLTHIAALSEAIRLHFRIASGFTFAGDSAHASVITNPQGEAIRKARVINFRTPILIPAIR